MPTTRPNPSQPGFCSSCGRPIYWIVMHPSGSRMPIDQKPVAGLISVEVGQPDTGHMRTKDHQPLYLSHFATCPNADQHRKEKR